MELPRLARLLQKSMETSNGENKRFTLQEDPPPRVVIPFAGKEVNVATALENRHTDLGLISDEKRPGDGAAAILLRRLDMMGASKLYLKTMPRLFEFATKKEGGFDSDFIAVAMHEMVGTAVRSGIYDVAYREPPVIHGDISTWRLDEKDKIAYFSRWYGRVEAIKYFIWDNPAMEKQKQELIENAKKGMRIRDENPGILREFP